MPTRHTCRADGCQRSRRRDQLMCYRCWAAVPAELQRAVYAAYDPAAGIRQSEEWAAAVSADITRDAGAYRICALGDIGQHAEDRWVAIQHKPCQEFIFGNGDDPDELDAAALLSLIAAHHCAPAACECGCLPGKPCGCSINDCECIGGADGEGDCPVCDADADACRPVTVTGDDGEPVDVRVHGGQEMSEEGRAAFGEIVRAAQRKMRDDLRREREERDADVRAVDATLRWIRAEISPERKLLGAINPGAWVELEDRFMDRIAALEARDAKAGG